MFGGQAPPNSFPFGSQPTQQSAFGNQQPSTSNTFGSNKQSPFGSKSQSQVIFGSALQTQPSPPAFSGSGANAGTGAGGWGQGASQVCINRHALTDVDTRHHSILLFLFLLFTEISLLFFTGTFLPILICIWSPSQHQPIWLSGDESNPDQ